MQSAMACSILPKEAASEFAVKHTELSEVKAKKLR
jgi:hypothetical protein